MPISKNIAAQKIYHLKAIFRMPSIRNRLLDESSSVSRFATVGIASTAIHYFTAFTLISLLKINPLVANAIGFSAAFFCSFTGNQYWSFKGRSKVSRSLPRLFIVANSGFVVNTLVLAYLINVEVLSTNISLLISIAAMPLLTYIVSRFWVFRKQ